MKIIKSHYIAFLIGAAIFFAGCAVLTVDVDVYKGPLANHKDVQIEQMAAMAIGAKPLLVELRDNLEIEEEVWELIDENGVDSNGDEWYQYISYENLQELRTKKWYISDYVKPLSIQGRVENRFKNSEAITVNDVLFLYKNRISDEYLELRTRSDQALKRYKDAYKSSRPETMSDDERLAKRIKLIDGEPENVKKLKKAYINFLSNKKRDALSVIDGSIKWLGQISNKDKRISELKTNPLLKGDAPIAKKVSNAAFHVLTETDLVDLHADLVFELQGDSKKELVSRIKEIAHTYLEARAALEDLWRISIETIIYINRRPMADGETIEQRRELTERFVGLSLELIQPKNLAMLVKAIDGAELTEDVEAFRSTYMTYANRHLDGVFSYNKAKTDLRDRLIADPIERAGKLLVAHEFSKYKFKPESKSKEILQDSLAYEQGWEFGLARSPYDLSLGVVEITQKTKLAFAGEGGALARGRLDKGLETLIEEYLNLAANDMANKDEVEFARRQLTNALVRFAEKVLFVANNNSLLQDPTKNEPGLFWGLTDVTARGLFGLHLIKRDEQHKYVRILQAVGNSILVQADALYQEEVHEKKMAKSVESEIYAINRTFTQLPSRVIDRLIQSLRAEQAAKTREIEKTESELTAAKEEWDKAKKDLEEIKKQVSNITPTNDETFVEAAKRQESEVISAHLLLVSQKPGDQTVQAARKLATEAQQAALDIKPEPNSPKEFALALAKELASKAKSAAVPNINDWLSNAGTYFNDKAVDFSQDKCINANKAYEKIINEMEKEYLTVDLLIDLAGKADKAKERADNQNKIVEDINKSVDKAKGEKTKVEHAISAIAEAKYDVLRKADEAKTGSKITAQFLYELLKVTVKESLDKAVDDQKSKFQNAFDVLEEQTPPIEPVVVDMSKLPSKATAKDVRDLWITVLQYEHDLALSKGEKPRADEIMEAIKEARKKREGMIFIRPAMAYLRTSFPATSLQSNPNLTWDNMLGGHMMRSMPFGPQIGEFFNPDAKRDARINAEIDKQFWQNINRVRVAGGGNTNYAVVKDDIGNWYVKGYSADPCDIIDSARNLGMFSLSEKLNTDLLGRINRDEDDLSSADKSDANQTAIERMYNKYTEQYNSRTSADRERLTDILEDEMKSAIMLAWQQNEGLEGSVSKLEKKLDAAIEVHLNKPTDELEETEDVTKQGSKIISALHAIRRFHNMLLGEVHDTVTGPARDKLLQKEKNKAAKEGELNNAKETYSEFAVEKDRAEIDWNNKSTAAAEDPDNPVKKKLSDDAKDALEKAKTALARAEEEVNEKQAAFEATTKLFETASKEYDNAIRAEEISIRDVTRIIREKIMAIIISRMDSVQDYETALMFIGESNTQ